MVGEHLDLFAGDDPHKHQQNADSEAADSSDSRGKFIGVRFQCCGSYARAYLNRAGTTYLANCPRCSKPVRFKVGPGGSDARFFEAY